VIILTRLGGHEMAVNPDLMERAEATPDTVITMVDGHKLVVAEPVDEVLRRVRTWRASVAAEAFVLAQDLTVEPDPEVIPELPGAAPEQDLHVATRAIADHSAIGNTLARVLRMPPRGE
jgi:flagellar protein FlbD